MRVYFLKPLMYLRTAVNREKSDIKFAFLGRTEVVKLLLQSGADPSLKDSDNKTVLHRAAESQNEEICRDVLKIVPFLKNEQDNKGKVPADYASFDELISLLRN